MLFGSMPVASRVGSVNNCFKMTKEYLIVSNCIQDFGRLTVIAKSVINNLILCIHLILKFLEIFISIRFILVNCCKSKIGSCPIYVKRFPNDSLITYNTSKKMKITII